MKKNIIKFSLLLLAMATIMVCFFPLMKDTNYGLDLKGGFEVLYEIAPLEGKKLTEDMVTATYKTLSRRIDTLGVSEPEISIEGSNRIRVKLAGITNKDQALEVLSTAASLTFRDTKDNILMTSSVLDSGKSSVTTDDQAKPAVALSIADVDKFYDVTNKVKDMEDNRIVIWLDFAEGENSFAAEGASCGSLSTSNCLSAATVSQAFASDVIIQGNFTKEEATALVDLINSGSLPTKLTELSSKSVSASFGENSLNKTFIAGVIGIALIFVMMISIYHFAGLIASMGLIIYTFLVFLVFWVYGGVLTLPGVASLILGIGMTIDANVLSFERIREELWLGHSLKEAFKTGYKHSLSSIIDGNVTTLIVAVVLFIFGESSVKGFATMLIISIFATILVMVFIVRKILEMFVKSGYFDNKSRFFINVKKKDIPTVVNKNVQKKESRFKKVDFLKNRKFFFAFSITIFLVGMIFTFILGLNLSVDFKGGTDFTIANASSLKEKAVVSDFSSLGYKQAEASNIDNKTVYVKMSESLSENKVSKVKDYFKEKYGATVESGSVSTIVKQELVRNAVLSIIFAMIGIIIYVSIRFTFQFAISAIIALLHDAFFVIAMFSILRLEIDPIFVAAILTIIGYSINDTVVIFDRIREEIKTNYRSSFYTVANTGLGITLTRSLYTVLTTLIPIVCLLLFGSQDILNFNIAMLFGVMVGCYSSICIASPLWYEMIKNKTGNVEKKKVVVKDKLEELTVKGINS